MTVSLDSGKVIVEVTLGNDAMSRPIHVCDILTRIANEIGSLRFFPSHTPGAYNDAQVRATFRDGNGNTVALWRKEEVDEKV